MAVMMPREKWTDERLDDLNKKVDSGFAATRAEMREGFTRVDADIRELRGDLNRDVGGLRSEMNARFDKMNERFEALNRTLIGGLFVVVAAIIGSNVL